MENNNDYNTHAHNDTHGFLECMRHCLDCAKMCMEEGQKKLAALCAECADICSLALKSKNYQSEFQHQITDLCSRICQKCAEECIKMETAHCQQCAEKCVSCSESCANNEPHY